MTFQEKLVVLRKTKGLTQDEFASAVGVSRQAVYKWESGQSYPEVSKLLEIKMLFGISIDDLLDDTYEVALPEKKKKKRISRAEKERIEREILNEIEVSEIDEVVADKEEEQENEEIFNSLPEAEKKEMKEEEQKQETKKIGFFGKLFGKK